MKKEIILCLARGFFFFVILFQILLVPFHIQFVYINKSICFLLENPHKIIFFTNRKFFANQKYIRQVLPEKLTNFESKLPVPQSKLARDVIKNPFTFELKGIKEEAIVKDIENAMMKRIKNVLLELGKGFSFLENQL